MFPNLECFAHAHFVAQAPFVLSLHVLDYGKVIFVSAVGAMLVVLSDSGVLPLTSVYGFYMFIPANFIGTGGLGNVNCFFVARALVLEMEMKTFKLIKRPKPYRSRTIGTNARDPCPLAIANGSDNNENHSSNMTTKSQIETIERE